ncbi:SDR family NAD(P)-dependent oxidoreductase [Variovorax sp. 770b2]|uniref:SDR family NAD(P)-dependent oxidoreductase n=1 Tax=Variovorax sp. 770b2 TaxID=1566271 RepID=UPI0008E5C929|nr:SDR family NAD(P)-dependent oxidoreductase [Variovorax sp. 770b2]SFP26291.1 NAD(P)-dependent dehydrogenase, short-chain alcohol dehydrogenase family [Variovorax sp. 770b2]
MSLDNRSALVTGAGSGIGRAIALALAREGASVLAADIDEAAARDTAASIEATGGRALARVLDVRQPQQHTEAVAEAVRAFGGLHIAVNNAGVSTGPSGAYRALADIDLDDWRHLTAVNLDGTFFGLRAQIPALLASGGGSIVNIASVMAVSARANLGAYVASKHGVLGLTRAAAVDYAQQKVRVNAIGPGYIDTPMLARKDAIAREGIAGWHPMGRLGSAQEIAELAAWLASERASFVTGAFYPVDGGYLVS